MKLKSFIRTGVLILILSLFLLPAGHTANTYGEAPLRTELSTAGTTYLSLGTSSGSKMYALASPQQFYVAERSNDPAPTFSTLTVSGDVLTVKTYDYEGNKYAGDFCIQKTAARINPAATAKKLQSLKKNVYTKASYRRLSRALKSFRSLFHPTAPDKGAAKASKRFRKKNDPLSYYGYAAGTSRSPG